MQTQLWLKCISIKWISLKPNKKWKPNKKSDQLLSTRKLGDQKKAEVLQIVRNFPPIKRNKMILNCLQMTETVESLIYVIDDISSKVAETLGCMPNLSALTG